MSMANLAYARVHYQSFCRSARHLLQIIGSHQSQDTGWAYLSYATIAFEVSLSMRRVIQLVAILEATQVLEVRRGHGRGNVNFYRILREEDGLPVPHRREKKVKSATSPESKKVQFPTPPAPEKVKSEPRKGLASFGNAAAKVVLNTKEREEKGEPPVALSPVQATARDVKRCGWGGCASPVCPHEVNFCASHADCERCGGQGQHEGH